MVAEDMQEECVGLGASLEAFNEVELLKDWGIL